jgi:hypothetical protein
VRPVRDDDDRPRDAREGQGAAQGARAPPQAGRQDVVRRPSRAARPGARSRSATRSPASPRAPDRSLGSRSAEPPWPRPQGVRQWITCPRP